MRKHHRHVATQQHHKFMLTYQDQQESAVEANATEEEWDFPEGPGGNLDDSRSLAPVSSEGGDDWQTSISEPLGTPATTLEAITNGESFPPGSKSPKFHYYDSQCPGQGAKYLTAVAFKVNATEVTKE